MCGKQYSLKTGVALNIGMALTLAVLPARPALSGGGSDYELKRAVVAPGGGISFTFGGVYLMTSVVGEPVSGTSSGGGYTLTAGFIPGIWADCNENGVPDAFDIAEGTSEDIDGDGIPDECQCGSDPDCDDGSACTTDSCTPEGLCIHIPEYDDLWCCNPATGGATLVDDGDVCTDDVCDAQTGQVTHPPAPAGAECDDADDCTVSDSCNGAGACLGTDVTTIPCSTDNDCPIGVCDTGPGQCICAPVPVGACCKPDIVCEPPIPAPFCAGLGGSYMGDGTVCGGDGDGDGVAEICDNCPLDANQDQADADGDGTGDVCDGCPNDPNNGCLCQTDADCDDGNVCTDDICNAGTCENPNSAAGTPCDDGQFCTTGEACTAGACGGGSPTDCSGAGDQCNTGVCNETNDACEPQPVLDGTACDDGLFCTTLETCTAGVCGGGSATDCSGAGDQCNTGVCNETTDACEPQPVLDGTACDDGQFCTTFETCTAGVCGGGSAIDCSGAGDQCNAGVCNETTDACEPQPVADGTACDDGQFCTTFETCTAGVCGGGSATDCGGASDQCNAGVCNETTDACQAQPINEGLACDDTDACTTADTCVSGECVGGSATACDDGNPCTADTCDAALGCLNDGTGITVACNDGNVCTTSDVCQGDVAGTCAGTFADSDGDGVCDADDRCPGGDDNVDNNGNGVPDDCDIESPALAGPPHDMLKNRYISIDPRGAGEMNAGKNLDIRLTLTATLVNGVTAVGTEWWANAPNANCIAVVGPNPPPVPPNWDACPTLHLTGCPIIPTSTYDIVVVKGSTVSDPPLLAATQAKPGTKWHGDCVGFFTGTEWTAPNANTNIDDAVAAIKTFQNPSNTPGCPAPPCNATHVSVTDMEPNLTPGPQINSVVNIADVFSIILGFQGQEYPGPDLVQCP